MNTIKRLRTRLAEVGERGASLVEYALLVALIAVVCIVAVTFLGTSGSSKFQTVGDSISTPQCPNGGVYEPIGGGCN